MQGQKMNKITLAEAVEHIRSTTPFITLPLDELLETSGGDGKEEEFSFWTDLYLSYKHPQGGEIYFQVYLDVSINWLGKVNIHFDDSNRSLNTEDLKIEDVNDLYDLSGDLLSSNPAEFHPLLDLMNPASEKFDQAKLEEIKNEITSRLKSFFGSHYTIDDIKSYDGYAAA